MFAGIIMGLPHEEIFDIPRRLAGKNFRAIYRTLSLQERTLVREEIAAIKRDPQGVMTAHIDTMRGQFSDPDFIDQIQKSDL
jgi:hypothetical protein